MSKLTNIEGFKEIIIKIPFEHNDLNVVNQEENLPLFEELIEIYIKSSPSEQNSMETFVRNHRDLTYKLVHWIPPYQESDPGRYVKYRLLSATIRDGMPDFRDDLLELVHLWDFAEEKRLNAREIFEEINNISSSSLFYQVMDPQRREELRF